MKLNIVFCFLFSVLEFLLSDSFFCLQSTFFASFMCFDVLALVPPESIDRRVFEEDDENSPGVSTNGRKCDITSGSNRFDECVF